MSREKKHSIFFCKFPFTIKIIIIVICKINGLNIHLTIVNYTVRQLLNSKDRYIYFLYCICIHINKYINTVLEKSSI